MEDEGLSTYEVARRSGGKIRHSTVWNIKNGRTKTAKLETLKALAKGLKKPPEEIVAIAFGKNARRSRHFRQSILSSIFEDFEKLSDKDQQFLYPYLEMLQNEVQKRLPK